MKQNEMNSQKAQELTKEELEQVNNSQKAQELTKEELEQVNGGQVTIQDILKSTTAILMFNSQSPGPASSSKE